jgi:hypothetical protein
MSTKATAHDVKNSKATLYVLSVLGLCFLEAAFVLAITFIRPIGDNTGLIAAVLGVIGPVQVALLAATVQEVHLAVNSRLTELVELTAKASKAEGKLEGPR